MSIAPVVLQELRVRMRGGTAYALLSAIILAFGAFTLTTYRVIANQIRPVPSQLTNFNNGAVQGPPLDRILVAQRGPIFFLVMSLWAIVLVALIVPASTSGAISREQEQHTLPLLLGTPLTSVAIVAGKLLGAVSYVLLLVAAAIPLFSMAVMFGGISVRQALEVAVLLAVTTFGFGALGLFYSSVTGNSLLASLLTYATALALTVGSYLIYLATGPLGNALNVRYLLYFSPLAAVVSALTEGNSQLATLAAQFFKDPGSRPGTDWWLLVHYPMWYVTGAAYLLGGVILVLAASRAIDPLRRWL